LAVRVIGASRNLPPLAFTASATLAVEAGTAVEQSITTVPGRRADSAPLSPSITASTCGVPVTQRISTSTCAASAHVGHRRGTGLQQRVDRLVACVFQHGQVVAVLDDVAGNAVAHQADADEADFARGFVVQWWSWVVIRV
jgi:hypothetical protein